MLAQSFLSSPSLSSHFSQPSIPSQKPVDKSLFELFGTPRSLEESALGPDRWRAFLQCGLLRPQLATQGRV